MLPHRNFGFINEIYLCFRIDVDVVCIALYKNKMIVAYFHNYMFDLGIAMISFNTNLHL